MLGLILSALLRARTEGNGFVARGADEVEQVAGRFQGHIDCAGRVVDGADRGDENISACPKLQGTKVVAAEVEQIEGIEDGFRGVSGGYIGMKFCKVGAARLIEDHCLTIDNGTFDGEHCGISYD